MDKNTSQYNIITTVNQNKSSDIIKFGNDFMKGFLFDENENAIDIQITALRVILQIYNVFSSSNEGNLRLFQGKTEAKQLKLFEDEFLTEQNQYVRITIKNSMISPDQNHTHIENAMAFLTDYKKDWHTSYNSSGKKIKSYGGLITMPSYEDKGRTTFLINSYWLKQIIDIDDYTYMLLKTAYKISSAKSILFLVWLGRVNKKEGTRISLEKLNRRFGLNYKTTKEICDQFLRPMKKVFDLTSMESFNFSRSGNIISIMPYTHGVALAGNTEDVKDKVMTIYKLFYYKKRHNLEGVDFEKLKIVYNQKGTTNKIDISHAYELLKMECRKNKIKMTDLQGIHFINELQKKIIENYKSKTVSKAFPNGYIAII